MTKSTTQLTENQTITTKLFENQSSKTPKCNKLIDIAIQLKELGKAEFSIDTDEFGKESIGIRLNNSFCWHWFELDFELDILFFEYRYSISSGQKARGFKIKYNFLDKIGFYNN